MPKSIRADECSVYALQVNPPHANPDPHVSPVAQCNCPVNVIGHQTLASARSLTQMLRMLRVSMSDCRTCLSKTNCPILTDFNAQLTTALQEIADEWQLT